MLKEHKVRTQDIQVQQELKALKALKELKVVHRVI